MGSKKDKEAIAIVLDIGESTKQPFNVKGDSFLTLSKECISHIVQRKIFANSSDLIGLIVFGCEQTCNRLATENGGNAYKHIALIKPHATVADWELLRAVRKIESNENYRVDWLDAIRVAVDFLIDQQNSHYFTHSKIVVFSNFAYSVSQDRVGRVVETINKNDINLVIIGPDTAEDGYLGGIKKSREQRTNERLVENIVNQVRDGVLCTFDDALPELMNIQRKSVKPSPWNALFTLTNRIKIPIRAYKKTAATMPPKWITSAVDDPNAFVDKKKTYTKLNENDEEVEVHPQNIIDAYQFGTTIVPFSNIDKQSMEYKSGEKGLYLIGVTKKRNVSSHILMGTGSYVLLARQDDTVAQTTLETLVKVMYEMNHIGIARRIYSNNSSALLVALFPVVSPDANYFVFTELPYAEDEHVFKFPPLSGVQLSDEQLETVDNLIDKMDFDTNEKQNEKYEPTKVYDHHEQYLFKVISYRALNPDKQVPETLIESSRNALKPSEEWIESYKNEAERVKATFSLERIERDANKRFKRKYTSKNEVTSSISNVGTAPLLASTNDEIDNKPELLNEKCTTSSSDNIPNIDGGEKLETNEAEAEPDVKMQKRADDSGYCVENDSDIDNLMDAF